MSLAPEVRASYAAIIDNVLANSDLTTISAKRVRKELAAQVGYDVNHQKDEINKLIGERFDIIQEQQNAAETTEPTTGAGDAAPATNGVKSEDPSVSSSPKKRADPDSSNEPESNGSEDAPTPPKKKQKRQTTVEEDDAAFAARLQAEENQLSRARSTRGGGAKRKPVVKKKEKGTKKKAKSAKKINSDEDSELDSGSGEKKEVKRTGGFHKPMALSQPLSELLGETQLSRPQCVKKIWDYIKAHDLQDPNDKRQIRCDDGLRTVFKTDKVHMFTMNKILNQNLYALDE